MDRHILVAVAHADEKVIVTYDVKDFLGSSLTPYSFTAQGPSAFLKDPYVGVPEMMIETLGLEVRPGSGYKVNEHVSRDEDQAPFPGSDRS